MKNFKLKLSSILALLIVLGFFLILIIIMFVKIPTNSESTFNIMLGILATLTGNVSSYYFGSSASSRKKDEMLINKLNETNIDNVN